MIYEVYGKLHRTAKKLLGHGTSQLAYRMVNVNESDFQEDGVLIGNGEFFNEENPGEGITRTQVYPIENIVPNGAFLNLKDSFCTTRKCSEKQLGAKEEKAE